ncbi:MAG: ATP-binding protein [Candidatus Omnitrophica bacterium]|nr:ATP-binding protein [Candidatus Omnitrophota bacterium]
MADHKIKVLVVEDNPDDAMLVQEMIMAKGAGQFELSSVGTLKDAQECLRKESFDLILLDFNLPDSHGLATIQSLQRDVSRIAIIVITGMDDEAIAIEALKIGAEDFLVKSQFDGPLLVRSARYAVERKRSEDLVKASKAKDEFVAHMTHELRTPLNSIIGFSDVLCDGQFGPLNERQKKYAQNILESGRHLLSLINDVLDLAKVESGKMVMDASVFPVKNCLEEALLMMEGLPSVEKVKPMLELAGDLGEIRADQRKIKQVVFNLLANAVKFNPACKVGIRARRIEGGIEVAVWDAGIGIAPENIEKVFGAFFCVENAYTKEIKGTGLGLAICRKIVELHGGKIWIESGGIGKGTTVKFTIPDGDLQGGLHG